MTARFACLGLSLACLASASCGASDTLARGGSTVAEAVVDGTEAVRQAASDAATTAGLSEGSKPSASGTRARARAAPSAAANRSHAREDAARSPSAGAPQDAAIGDGTGPDIAFDEPVNRESVHEPSPVLAAAQAAQTAPAPAPPHLVRSDRIYSGADPDVTPAVLLTTKEAGPIFQGVQGSVNTMELVISREGRVETVRLLTPAIRMTDMLLLSGAKTWKFAPALKDGQPVRYRTRFNWESTP